MSTSTDRPTPDELKRMTATIVKAFIAGNPLEANKLPALIKQVYKALEEAHIPVEEPEPEIPAVPIEESVYHNYIICLEDGRHMTLLKSHLKKIYGMTPDQYREKWGLPPDYPMVPQAYVERRAAMEYERKHGHKMPVRRKKNPNQAPRLKDVLPKSNWKRKRQD
jgi:predicted transcriptional regulator